ncbi:hypothetical protein [Mycobacterium marinum]|nr:hypothetical protein [Mycobacterium marinum]MDC8972339.1 hypothetical protein [Mycobacterium marinum]
MTTAWPRRSPHPLARVATVRQLLLVEVIIDTDPLTGVVIDKLDSI